MAHLLLLSNSTQHGYPYLAHAASTIQDFMGSDVARVLSGEPAVYPIKAS